MSKKHNPLVFCLIAIMLISTACGQKTTPVVPSSPAPAEATSAPAEATPISIGAILPLTGSSAHEGQDMRRGAELAMNEINALGGIGGRPLEIIFEDDEDTPVAGMDAVHKLIDVNQVPVIVASFSSGVTLPMAEYANTKSVVMINPGATSPKLAEVGPYLFSTIGLDNLMGSEVAKFALEDGMKRCAVIIPNNPYGLGMEEWMVKTFEAGGGEIVVVIEYALKQTDYRAELQRVLDKQPECILYSAYGEESKIIARQAFEMGLQAKWFDGYVDMCTAVAEPATVEGHMGLDPSIFIPEAIGYRERFTNQFGEAPASPFSLYSYDAVWLAAITIGMVGTDPVLIQKALPVIAIHYRAASGELEFDANGMRVKQVYARLMFQGGKLVPYTK